MNGKAISRGRASSVTSASGVPFPRVPSQRRDSTRGAIPVVFLLMATSGCATWSAGKGTLPVPATNVPITRSTPHVPLGPAALDRAESTEVCLATAREMEQGGFDREAAGMYEQARKFDPAACDFSRRLATLYDRLESDAAARTEYQAALAQSPRDADLWNDFGVFHLRREQWSEAEKLFRQALDCDPRHQRAQVNLGVALGMQGRLPESHAAFAVVVGDAAAWSNVGVLLARQGRVEEAKQHYQEALSRAPDLEHARRLLATASSGARPPAAGGPPAPAR